ncbi:MAG TPA: hypothetical protein VE988_11535 [Gemmataceae bacterium]|nr:hypothetical protein [Gemmataceae bacterium]
MWRSLLGAVTGLLVGSALGAAFGLLMPNLEPKPTGWTSYPTLNSSTGAMYDTQQMPFTYYLMTGVIFGGGALAIAGSIVGATSAICHAASRRPPN